ncbi:MAG: class I SAM-dependent methyltransferase [Rhodospirillaceae bacterium]|nr:class I SAM-dependent methyltransferase [Rhodospirillaceae bacterium]
MTASPAPLPVLNWLEGRHDVYSRAGAADLQSAIHRNLMNTFRDETSAAAYLATDRSHWRQQAIIKAQFVMGRTYTGTILEIGAGTGWASSLLSTLPQVEKVYCSDYDAVSVETLMPQVQKTLNADAAKIQRVFGSFNNIPMENEVDTVISIGALHHSENLFVTLSECFKALKPGGWLVASEPTYPDSENNRKIEARYKKEDATSIKKYGKVTRHEDNSDHYYRLSEFIAAAYSAKFDTYPFVFDLMGSRQADDRILQDRKVGTGFFPNVLYPYFAKNPANPMFDILMLVLQKPADGGCDLKHVLSGSGQVWAATGGA